MTGLTSLLAPLSAVGTPVGVDHDAIRCFAGPGSGSDGVLDVAAASETRSAIGYFNGDPLGRDFDGSIFAETWYRINATTGQAGFIYEENLTTGTRSTVLLEPRGTNGSVTGWALDRGFIGVDPDERYYIGGYYSGSGMSSAVRDLPIPSSGVDGFVARLTGDNTWAGQLLGTGDAYVYGVSTLRDLVDVASANYLERLAPAGEDGLRTGGDPAAALACVGTFTNTLQYDYDDFSGAVTVGTAAGVSDGFILVLNGESGELLSSVTLGAAAQEVDIRDAAVSFVVESAGGQAVELPAVFVTGSFTGTVDFNPNSTAQFETATGDRDIFVAQYHPDGQDLVLDWVWTSGVANKEASGEGIDVVKSDNVFDVCIAGWADFESGISLHDIWFARLNYDPDNTPKLTVPWEEQLANGSTCRAYDAKFDAYNQVVMTGYFAGILDFDAGAGVDSRTSVSKPTGGGSYDLFVAKYTLGGSYAGTDTYGAEHVDVGYAIDANRATGDLIHGGYFGGGSSTGYTIDFDPDPIDVANAVGAGGRDAFVNGLVVGIPVVDTAIMLVLDDSGSMTNDDCGSGTSHWRAMIEAYQDIIVTDGAIVPRDGTVALAAVIFSDSDDTDDIPEARQVIPWTDITSAVDAQAFASALGAIQPVGGSSPLADGLKVARESFEDGLVDAGHNIINVAADAFDNQSDVENERDAAIHPTTGEVEMITGVAIQTDDPNLRDDFSSHLIGYNPSLSATGRYGCVAAADGIYAICPPQGDVSDFQLQQIVKFLFEIKGCQGDYDEDCVVDQSDLGVFLAAYGSQEGDTNWDARADLDNDDDVDQTDMGLLLAAMTDCPE